MEFDYTEADILLKNAQSLGIDLIAFYDEVGRLIAEKIIEKYGKTKSYAVICGKGGNSGDGLATAFHLSCIGAENVTVYLAGRKQQIESQITRDIFSDVLERSEKENNLTVKQDVFAKDIEKHDVIIEALVGTGLEGSKLLKRFRDIIKRVAHFSKPIIAIDQPTPHYEPDSTFSLLYPKVEKAYVIDIKLPREIELYCGPGEREALWVPNTKSHLNKNGNLLYIAQDDTHNEAVIKACADYRTNLSIFTFEHLTDEVTTKKRIKASELEHLVQEADTIFLGDIKNELVQYASIKHIMQQYHGKTWVVTGSSATLIDLILLDFVEHIVFVMDLKDLGILLGRKEKKDKNFEGKVKRFCIQNKVNIMLVGSNITMYNQKGDMRRVPIKAEKSASYPIASYTAAFSTKNDLWLSMRAVMG